MKTIINRNVYNITTPINTNLSVMNKTITSQNHRFNLKTIMFLTIMLLCKTTILQASSFTDCTSVYVDSEVENKTLLLSTASNESNDLETFHLFSHGRSGELLINGEWKNAKAIVNFLNSEFNIQNSTVSYLNIYGCEFAKGENGLKAVSYLEKALGLKVNASTNITGVDGDWLLEIGEIETNINNYQYNLQTAGVPNSGANEDYDGDGVINSEDLDDDNDGILDETECPNSSRRFEWQAANFTNAGITSANGQTVDFGLSTGIDLFIGIDLNVKFESTNYPNGNTSQLVNGATNQIVWANTPGETQTLTLTFSDPLPYTTFQMIFDPQLSDGELNTFQANAPGSFEHPLSAIGDGVLGSNLVRNPVGGPTNHAYQNQAPGDFLRYNVEEGATTFVMTTRTAANGHNTASNNGFLLVFSTPAPCDTDGDGLLDYLDLDSDGDGCPDATEGGDNYTTLVSSSISGGNSGNDYVGNSTVGVQNNLGNTVNTSGNNIGVPIITGSGQTVGSSQTGGAVFTDFTPPENISICTNAVPNEVTFTSKVNSTTPSNATINYQWQVSTDGGGSFSNVSGGSGTTTAGTDNDLVVSGIDTSFNGNVYKIIFSSSDNSCPEEGEATLTVNAPPTVTIDSVDPICFNADAITLTGTPATGGTFSGTGVSGTTFNPTTATAGTHTITYSYTDANGCTSTATTDIEVLAEETVTLTATTSPTTACEGTNFSSTFATTPSASTVTWTGDNGTPSDTSDDVMGTGNIPNQSLNNPTTSDITYTYVAVATSPNGCSTDTETISVTVVPKPEITPSVCEIEICSEDTANITFTSTASSTTYTWSSDNGTPANTADDTTGTGDISEELTNTTASDVTHVYTIIGTANGCDSEPKDTQVVVKPKPNAGADQTIGCFSQDTATMAGTGTGTWSLDGTNSAGTATITNTTSPTTTVTGFSATGIYTLTWTAANGCTDTVTINAGNACVCTNPPSVTLSDTTGDTCGVDPITVTGNTFGGYATEVTLTEDGAGSLTATSATTSPFEFTYTPAASDAGNTVTITVTTNNPNTEDGLCEAATATYTLSVHPTPTVDAGDDFTITCVDNTDGLQIGEANEAGYEYSWTPTEGLSVSDESNPTAAPTQTTTYTVTKTEIATDCSSTATVTVTVNTTAPTVMVAATDETAVDANDGTLTATVTGGQPTYMFSWDRTEPTAATGVYITQSVDDVTPGTYQVTVTDENGCFVTSNTVIVGEYNCNTAIQIEDPTLSEVDCFGGDNGEAVIPFSANNGPFHIVLTKGTSIIQDDVDVATSADINYTGLSTGAYTVTITDSKGCIGSRNFEIEQPMEALIANATTVENQLTFGGSEGSVTAEPTGGTPDYTYSWTSPDYPSFSSTDQTPTGLLPGTYNVVVTDANNCTTDGTTIVQQLGCDVAFTVNAPEILCFEDTVTVTVTASGGTGPYSYSWVNNDGDTNADSDPSTPTEALLEAGSYTITVTDANNCPVSQTLDLTEPAKLSLAIDINPVACYEGSTATIDLTVLGGVEPYEYSWTKDGVAITADTQDLSNLAAGLYEVTVTDANDCFETLEADVTEPEAAVEVTLNNKTDITCNANAVITINQPTGGTADPEDYTYVWVDATGAVVTDEGDADPLTFEVATVGTYTLTVRDINSCSDTLEVIVESNKDLPVLTLGDYSCDSDASTYGVGFFTNGGTLTVTNAAGADITSSVTIGTDEITNIPFGTDVTITVEDSTTGCSTSISANALTECPTNCVFSNLTIGQPICDGGTTNTYTVNYEETSGATITVTTTSGTVSEDGDGIIQAAIGTNITVTATNGDCVVSYDITSPTNCDDPCANPPITIGGTECATNGDATYSITYSVIDGATVTSSPGDSSVSGIITGIPSGTDAVLTIVSADCSETTTVTVPAAECPECQLPTLTLGNVTCNATGFSVEVISNSSDIDSTGGTPSATLISGIGFGETVTITAGSDSCTTSIEYTAGTKCPTECVLPDLTLGQAVCNGQGATTYTVSYTENTGATITVTTAGVITSEDGDGVITADIGDNITITATNGECVVTLDINSPTNCDDPCGNPLISIGGTECSTNGDATYSVYYTAIDGATVSSTPGDSSQAGIITGITSGTDVTLTVTYPGCPETTTVIVPAADCPECQLPTLTLGNVSCDATGYSIEVISNSTDIDSTGGTPSSTMVSGIGFGETVTITAGTDSCTTSIEYTAGTECFTDCVLPDLTLGQPVCNGQGSTTYTVSYTENTGATITVTTAGVITSEDGDRVITADIGDNITVTATNGNCVVTYNITSPASCDDPCDNPLISIGGTDCAIDGSAFYSVYYTAITGAIVSSSTGDSSVPGVITGISSVTDVILTVTYPGCPETTTVTVPAANCPSCILPILTVLDMTCASDGTVTINYTVSDGATVSIDTAGDVVGTEITGVPVDTAVTITAMNGDCSVSIETMTMAVCPEDENCDIELSLGQPMCGLVDGNYSVSFTTNADVDTELTVSAGVSVSGNTLSAPINTPITVTVTDSNDSTCTRTFTVDSNDLDCPGEPCSAPALSFGGTDCSDDGSASYTINFSAAADTVVTATDASGNPVGTVDVSAGTVTGVQVTDGIITLTGMIANCVTSTTVEVPVPNCPSCILPILTVLDMTCASDGTVTINYTVSDGATVSIDTAGDVVGTEITGVPVDTAVTITAMNGDCSVSIETMTMAVCPEDENCDIELSLGQPMCGLVDGNYSVSFTTNADVDTELTVSAGVSVSGNTLSAPINTPITVTVTDSNDSTCTRTFTVDSNDLDCPGEPCSAPALSFGGTDCSADGSASYTINFSAAADTVVTATDASGNPVGTVDVSAGTVTGVQVTDGIITLTGMIANCVTSTTVEVPVPNCPSCILPILTVLDMTCASDGTVTINYTVSDGATVSIDTAGDVVGTEITGLPVDTAVTVTATNGDCSVSIETMTMAVCPEDENCDIELSLGQPMCGLVDGNYSVSFTTNADVDTELTVSAGVSVSGNTLSAPINTPITVTVTDSNDSTCTRTFTVDSNDLDCPGEPCSAPALSFGGTDCSADGSASYTINFSAAADTVVTATDASGNPVGTVDVSAGTVTGVQVTDGIITLTGMIANCVTSTTVEVPVPNCPSCILPILTVLDMTCASDGTVTINYTVSDGATVSIDTAGDVVGTEITGVPVDTAVTITAMNGDCSVSIETMTMAVCPEDENCDIELSLGQPICGLIDGNYSVSFTTNADVDTELTVSAGVSVSGNTLSAPINTPITVTVTDSNDSTCTRTFTVDSNDLDCPGEPCSTPALSFGGTDCSADGSASYTINFSAAADTVVTATDASGNPVGTVDVSAGIVTGVQVTDGIITLTGMIANCVTSTTVEAPVPNCPSCILPILTVLDMTCASDGTVTINYTVSDGATVSIDTAGDVVGTEITGVPVDTAVTVTAMNGDCSVSIETMTMAVCPEDENCDIELSLGQPMCGLVDGNYSVSFTTNADVDTELTVSAGVSVSGNTLSAPINTPITVTVTDSNDSTCTRTFTVDSNDLDCPGEPCSAPALSFGGTDCSADGSASYTINFSAAADTVVTATDASGNPVGTVDVSAGTVTGVQVTDGIITLTGMIANCVTSTTVEVPVPNCPSCILPILTVLDMTCASDGTVTINYTVSDGATVSIDTAGDVVGTEITGVPVDTAVTVTAMNGDCSVSIETMTMAVCPEDENCDIELSLGQPMCGLVDGNYSVSFTTNADVDTELTVSAGVSVSGNTLSAPINTPITVTVTDSNDSTCTRTFTVDSNDLDCPGEPCSAPALSFGGTDCSADGSASYTINFSAAADTVVTATDASGNPVGTVDVSAGTVTGVQVTDGIITLTGMIANCVTSTTVEVPVPNCPSCILPILTVGTTECQGTTYSINYISNGTVTVTSDGQEVDGVTVGSSLIIGIPLGTDVIVTSTNGECTSSISVTSLQDPCDTDCDELPGLIVIGQPICSDEGTYAVSFTVEDTDAVINVDGGTYESGTATAALGTAMIISVTNACGTESMSVNSDDLDCPGEPCSNPAISISGSVCGTGRDGTYTINFEVEAGTSVIALGTDSQLPIGDVDTTAGTVSNIPFDEAVTLIATIDGCATSQSVDMPLPNCSSMELEKTASVDAGTDGIINAGDEIEYTFTVENTGNVTLSDITVTDAMLGVDSAPVVSPVLAPGQVGTYTATYIITQADIDAGGITNTATADAEDPNGNSVTDISDDPNDDTDVDTEGDGEPDDATVTDLSSPMIAITKDGVYVDGDNDGVVEVGEIITYTFVVTNTGNVDITGVTIDDTMLDITGLAVVPADLAPGEPGTVTVDYAITEADITAGAVYNLATGTGTAPDGTEVTDESEDPTPIDPTLIDPTCPDCTVTDLTNPQMELEKTASVDAGTDGIINAGDEITYMFTVTNTGNVDLTNVTISDPLLVAPNGSITGGPIAILAAGDNDTATFVGTYTIQQSDIDSGSITNSATVSGTDPNGNEVTDISDDPNDDTDVDTEGDGEPDDATVTVLPSPKLSIIKSIIFVDDINNNSFTDAGDRIDYAFEVRNTGNVDLTNVEVNDPLLGGLIGTIVSLPAGGTGDTSLAGSYIITAEDFERGYVENTATASGTATTNPDGTTLPTPIDVTDVSDAGTDENGDPITDPEGVETPDGEGNTNDNSTDDPTVLDIFIDQSGIADLSITKTIAAGITTAQPGEEITFVITVSNAGPGEGTGISVQEQLPSGYQYISSFPASGSYDPVTGLWTELDAIPIDSSIELTINVLVLDSGDYTNYVQIMTSDQLDPNSVPGDNSTGDDDDATIGIEVEQLYVIKTGEFIDTDDDGYAILGETVTYVIEVHNEGTVAISDVVLTDDNADAGSVTYETGDDNTNDILDIGEVWYYIAVHTITQADIDAGSVTNTAIASGVTPGGTLVIDESDDDSPFEDDATVTVLPTCGENLIVHNVITPSDASVNNVFVIANLACAPDNTVKIFNRWGVLVYETENYGSNGNYFNGTSEGRVNVQNNELPVGTYYYVIDYVSPSGANKSTAGYLYIKR